MFGLYVEFVVLGPVVQNADNFIQWIGRYAADKKRERIPL